MQTVKWNISETDFSGCVQHIFCSVPQITLPKLFFRCQSQCLCSRKRIIFCTCAACFSYSKFPANIFNTLLYSCNIILLRDQEWNNHLPQILLQNADSASHLSCCCQIFIPWIDHVYIFTVITIQIKIPDPEENEIFFRTKEIDNSSLLSQFQIFISRNHPVTVITDLIHPKALPGSADLPQVKIIHFYCQHTI